MFRAESAWGFMSRSATQARFPLSTVINTVADVESVTRFAR
jgi:hypothetical protein